MSDDRAESFASLFEAMPQKRTRAPRLGERLDALVVQVTPTTVFVELDGKQQAFLEAIELEDESGQMTVQPGQRITAQVVSIDETSGAVRLAKKAGRMGGAEDLMRAREAGVAVEGKVAAVNKGGLEIDLGGGAKGFCPISQIEASFVKELEPYLGRALSFLVTEVKGGRAVLSRRKLLEREAQAEASNAVARLEVGATVKGTVTGVREFGAFVDLGGVEGLVPRSEASHDGKRIEDVLSAGQAVEVKILDVKVEEGQKRPRITLSLKALVEGPAGARGPAVRVGQVVEGTVDKHETFGLFVQLAGSTGRQGRGLVPNGELGVPRGTDTKKAFPLGTVVKCLVLETADNRIRLSIKGAEAAEERAEYEAAKAKVAPAGGSGFGTLGDLLAKMKK